MLTIEFSDSRSVSGWEAAPMGKYIAKAFVSNPNTRITIASRNPKIDDLRKLGNQIFPPVSISISSDRSSSSDQLSEICKDANLVINLPGIMHETPSENITFENVQHQGARNVAKAAHQNNARLIHISAIGADPNSDIPYAKTKGLGEIAVREECPDAIIFRPSIIFGPEDNFFNVRRGRSKMISKEP
ncbi:18877_t:CDS:2 [Entrophospora sp. SA101]|nr:2914_t:CDS:2 [Entrophospora sp. SA101]CAJ0752586.1 18877_t:CDS:2 [Entrophospora sp. SA101]CAJ0861255.1 20791_t:CDS:2 [Entrophospora sp. SA101]CAJ0887378.1 5397_t:CDS:2 [Entrophospora sp. SA101]